MKRHLDWGDLSGYEDIDSKGGSASKKKGFQKRNAPYFRFTSNNVASDSTASIFNYSNAEFIILKNIK